MTEAVDITAEFSLTSAAVIVLANAAESQGKGTTMTSEQIETALDRIRPYLRADGGNVELLEVVGNSIRVKLTGACHGCPASMMTLRHGIERILREEFPELESVMADF
jgi:Fe-S cluster biogenesis protein NfuA